MDFDEFDSEDAAILGEIIGFAEESLSDEEEYLRNEALDAERSEDEPAGRSSKSQKKYIEKVVAGLNPELKEAVLRSVIVHRLTSRILRKIQKNYESLYEISRRLDEEMRTRGFCRIITMTEYLSALNQVNGQLRPEDYEEFPDLFFIEEAKGNDWELEFDYVDLMGEKVKRMVGKVEDIVKDKGKIYLVVQAESRKGREVIAMEAVEWIGTPGAERVGTISKRVKNDGKKRFPTIAEAKGLAKRVKLEFGVRVFVDDILKHLEMDIAEVHIYVPDELNQEGIGNLKEFLEAVGCEEKEVAEQTSLWEYSKPGLSIFLHSSKFEYKRAKRKYEALTKLFQRRPDYKLVARKIAEVSNLRTVKEIFLALTCHPNFGNSQPIFANYGSANFKVLESIEHFCGTEGFVDMLGTHISCNYLPEIHIYISNEEMEKCAISILNAYSDEYGH